MGESGVKTGRGLTCSSAPKVGEFVPDILSAFRMTASSTSKSFMV